jgi:RimJ/RimL family protein N-acetyltransferase
MSFTPRTAKLIDANILLDWRNNSTVREYSTNPQIISYEKHLVWLADRLQRVGMEPFFVFENNGEMVGTSRLDLVSQPARKYEISLLVDPLKHSQGFGTRILKLTCDAFFDLKLGEVLQARIHPENFISIKLFKASGFEKLKAKSDFLYFEKKSRG